MREIFSANKLRLFYYFLSIFLLVNTLWITAEFGNVGFEQIILHIQTAVNNYDNFDRIFILSYLENCLIASIFLSFSAVLLEINLKKYFRLKLPKSLPRILYFLSKQVPTSIFLISIFLSFPKFGIFTYVSSSYGSEFDYIENNYIDPSSIKITKSKTSKTKNLILIYVEGLEETYSDKNLFGEDLLENLNQHKELKFDNYVQLKVIHNTLTGIVATQCSIPLKTVFLSRSINLQGENSKSFLPNANCLGNTLKELGYYNVFLGGASLAFAGKGKFLKNHGYDETYGRDEWIESGKYSYSMMNGWGLNDDDLFIEARQKLDSLQKLKQPFNLTVLTVNTHHPNGYFTKNCHPKNSFVNIVKCSTDEIADFVKYVKDKGYLSNTNIVIIGDHLASPNKVYDKLENYKNRLVYNSWISDNKIEKNRDEIVHFDVAPSILEFIGFEVEGNKYGLGNSAFLENSNPPNKSRIKEMNDNLLKQSDFYLKFWEEKIKVTN